LAKNGENFLLTVLGVNLAPGRQGPWASDWGGKNKSKTVNPGKRNGRKRAGKEKRTGVLRPT